MSDDITPARAVARPGRTVAPAAMPTIRQAREDELGEIAALFPPALASYRDGRADAALDAYLGDLVDGVRSRFEAGECYVAVSGGRLVGAVVFYPDVALEGWSNLPAGWAGFRALVVHPTARGAGVGRALVEQCVARACETGARMLGIHTADVLADAMRLYERLGFVPCPEYDLTASAAFPIAAADDVAAIAFRLDLRRCERDRLGEPARRERTR